MSLPRVVCVVGPTASGKSAVSELVALELGSSVVSVDAMQVYRGMDVGTAKTPVAVAALLDLIFVRLIPIISRKDLIETLRTRGSAFGENNRISHWLTMVVEGLMVVEGQDASRRVGSTF